MLLMDFLLAFVSFKYENLFLLSRLGFYHIVAQGHGNLYGGRMTASRLEQVGQVTSEAIERLHR